MKQIKFTQTEIALSKVCSAEINTQARPIFETWANDLKRVAEEIEARRWKHQQEETQRLINQAIVSEFASTLASN